LGIVEVKLFTDQMLFLLPNQQHQITAMERQLIVICNVL